MSQKFNSISERLWLKDNHEDSRNRSIELGKKAIDLLVSQDLPVTLDSVSEKSKEIDTKGIHRNTIRTNEILYAYYKKHSTSYKQKQNSNKNKIKNSNIENIDYQKLSCERNPKSLEKKYMQLTKNELVHRLIHAEQYIAENNKKWITNYFEVFK